ncbi:high light inducible protein [Synechococcus sp. A15-24]|uniref:high light inducible protein n=1 Tax=Synechococcus sp. A15-24 TaxID=1050635 RepID=UPI001646A6A5|nr:high light inducible protein [Synechococcus sp. A15-24]QNJ29121.1 high light inducible protein [Synechococcus sp. A15-24]
MTRPAFQYEQPERFGESLTTARPWNQSALTFVERLNGRAAMVGFSAAVLGELFTGQDIVGQLTGVVRWYLELG